MRTGWRAKSDRARITAAMKQLSVEQRIVLHRCFYWGRTTGQAAADLGITDSTVKSRLHDALHTLVAYSATDAMFRQPHRRTT
jgi:DNA-directed RNA polymerase specialized sigma24 family protein